MSNVLDQTVDLFEPAPELVSMMTDAAAKRSVLLAIDIGTSGTRAAIFDERGAEIHGTGVQSNRLPGSAADFSTWDPDELRLEVAQAIDATLVESRFLEATTHIRWIAVSCFWHSLLGIDAAGQPTTRVLGWADNRAVAEVSELRSKLNEAEVHSRTGCRLHPSYWPAKLLRLRNQEPEAFKRTTTWLSFGEYLALELFGKTAASISMASGTGLLNQQTCDWDRPTLAALDINIGSLPEIAASRKTFHGLSPDYAERWPQLSEARIFPAIGDGAANCIGAGCASKEKLALMIGTSGAMRVLYSGEPPAIVPPELWSYRADRDRVVVGGALSDGGGLYHWLRESLMRDLDASLIETELSRIAPDSHGLTILPFWAGERSTGWHAEAQGAILGLSAHTRPVEILRAAMEAIAYRLALIARALEPLAPGAAIVASGNALRSSRVWGQILADVLGRRVTLGEESQASMRGAALLALEAAGKIQSIAEFSMPVETVFEPMMSHHERYQQALDRQERIYQRVFTNP